MRGLRTVITLTVTAAVAFAIGAYAAGWFGGRATRPAIRVEGERLVVENQSNEPWRNVNVSINAYYRAAAQTLEPGGRLETPLANLETGLGHRFDVRREHVSRVEVRATSGSGQPVTIDWDGGK